MGVGSKLASSSTLWRTSWPNSSTGQTVQR
jgi:hypothetical protein